MRLLSFYLKSSSTAGSSLSAIQIHGQSCISARCTAQAITASASSSAAQNQSCNEEDHCNNDKDADYCQDTFQCKNITKQITNGTENVPLRYISASIYGTF